MNDDAHKAVATARTLLSSGDALWSVSLLMYLFSKGDRRLISFAVSVYANLPHVVNDPYLNRVVVELQDLLKSDVIDAGACDQRATKIWELPPFGSLEKRGLCRLFAAIAHWARDDPNRCIRELAFAIAVVTLDNVNVVSTLESAFWEACNGAIKSHGPAIDATDERSR